MKTTKVIDSELFPLSRQRRKSTLSSWKLRGPKPAER